LFGFVARIKCSEIMGNLLRTRKWVGFAAGMSARCNAGGGFSKGSIFCFGVAFWSFGKGFFASDGQ
jgi:hypothetical protein